MTHKLKYTAIGAGIAAALLLATVAEANPSYFMRLNSGVTSTATTSVSYMTPGTGTTTKYADLGVNGAGGADGAVFTEEFLGSSTGATLNTSLEYAQGGNGLDCIATPSSCDWFASGLSDLATTTYAQSIGTAQTFTLPFASTTQGAAAGSGDGRILRVLTVRTPMRYVRAVMTLPIGSTNGAVWGEFVAKRQAN